MRLIKKAEPLEFAYEDAVFLVKPHASDEDRMEVILAGSFKDGKVAYSKADFCRTLIRQMVVGWRNVWENDGTKELAYSFEALDQLPRIPNRNVFLELGKFIQEKTDVLNGPPEAAKNA